MAELLSEAIHVATKRKLQLFDSIRNKDIKSLDIPFWDIVVVTAVDEQQKLAYEQQITKKIFRGELPSGLVYEVIHDPQGPKIGNGGATLHAIAELERIHGREMLSASKVLMLHAGGFSQRLPSASVLGKIFTAVPFGNPVYQMFEVKLALCIEFPQRMKPGVFISCPDIMELFTIEDGDWSFEQPGITALAHPSPIEIGTTHGVFVLAENPYLKNHADLPSVTLGTCTEFLHKPSKDTMHEKNAVFSIGEDYVYTDSEFFMDWATVMRLLTLYKELSPLGCEIDAYGDFLQGLGQNGTAQYCQNVANVVEVLPKLVKTREKFFKQLRGTQFNVLLFNKSKFYHIGTISEYLDAFCDNFTFRYEMCLKKRVSVTCCGEDEKLHQPESTCILHSFLNAPVSLGSRCVVEYSYLESGVSIGHGSIVSNMLVPAGMTLPDWCFFHTVCISIGETDGLYVTIIFHVQDNLKKVKSNIADLNYCGKPLDKTLAILNIQQKDLWPSDCTMSNLWHAKLFPAFSNQKASSCFAVEMAYAALTSHQVQGNKEMFGRWSMSDIVKMKDVKGTLKIRDNLRRTLGECSTN